MDIRNGERGSRIANAQAQSNRPSLNFWATGTLPTKFQVPTELWEPTARQSLHGEPLRASKHLGLSRDLHEPYWLSIHSFGPCLEGFVVGGGQLVS